MPSIYIAISPTLYDEIQFAQQAERLAAQAVVERWPGPGSPPLAAVAAAAERCEVLVTGWGTPALVDTLRAWSPERFALRLVGHTAGSIKHLLPPEALQAGLRVSHSNDSLAEAVAEFTLGSIIAARRQMFLAAKRFKNRQPAPAFTTMRELAGSTIGIIGASAIGRRVMDLLRPWKVRILLYDPYASAESAAAYAAQPVDLLTLMRASDIVSLHAPVTPETLNMLGAEHFAAMPAGALFINTARGRLVDHDALLAELQTGRISAVLDVTDPHEPLPVDSPFFQLENCTVFPHIAGHSVEARQRQGQMVADDVLAYLCGQPLAYEVNVQRWSQMA